MLKNLDFLEYQPKVSVNGSFGYRTFIGTFISFLIGVLTILCAVGFGQDIVFREKPNSFITELSESTPMFNAGKIQVALAPALLGGVTIPEVRSYLQVKYGSVDSINTINGSNRYEFYDPPRCIDSPRFQNDPILNSTKTLHQTDQYVCAPQQLADFQIEGIYGSNNRFKAIDIRILPCQNTTDYNGCKSDLDIKNMLKLFYVALIVQSNIVNPLNYTNPIATTFYTSLIRLTSYGTRQESVHLRLLDFISDAGFILSTKSEQSTFIYDHSLTDSNYDPDPSFFLRILVSGHSVRSQYYREYLKIQKIAADVGGIIKFILIFAKLFNSLYALESLNVTTIAKLIDKHYKIKTSIPHSNSNISNTLERNESKQKIISTINDVIPNSSVKTISLGKNNFLIQNNNLSELFTSKN